MAVEDVLTRARMLADLGRDDEAEPLLTQHEPLHSGYASTNASAGPGASWPLVV